MFIRFDVAKIQKYYPKCKEKNYFFSKKLAFLPKI